MGRGTLADSGMILICELLGLALLGYLFIKGYHSVADLNGTRH